jgi:hypothetical protein
LILLNFDKYAQGVFCLMEKFTFARCIKKALQYVLDTRISILS